MLFGGKFESYGKLLDLLLESCDEFLQVFNIIYGEISTDTIQKCQRGKKFEKETITTETSLIEYDSEELELNMEDFENSKSILLNLTCLNYEELDDDLEYEVCVMSLGDLRKEIEYTFELKKIKNEYKLICQKSISYDPSCNKEDQCLKITEVNVDNKKLDKCKKRTKKGRK